ncbi:MAG TPA: SLC13 family permease [Steroidobacteraceae bacterium]|nr:SLC13 family permease [Steroidobacteraceae bacterium]
MLERESMTHGDAAPGAASHTQRQQTSALVLAGQILCLIVPVLIWFSPLQLEPRIKHMFAIGAFMIIAWITQAAEFALAGFIGCFLFWALGVAPFSVAFGGFANNTAWFLFGAMLIGLVADRSGLARRLAYTVMGRVGISYSRILLGLAITSFLLTFIVPSGLARVVVLAAIALALLEAFQARRGSNIARGMFLMLTYTGNIFDKMLLAGAGSITAAGLIQKMSGIRVLWGQWLFAFLPCSIATVLFAWWLTLRLYPPEQTAFAPDKAYFQRELARMGPWSAAQTKAAMLIGCAMLLWMTDSLHHIPPTMVALGVGLFALLPRVGVLDAEDMRRLNYMPVFFVAEALSMGGVLEATHGLGVLTGGVFHWIQPALTNIYSTTAVLYWTAFVYHFLLASEISMLATSIPLVVRYATSHGFNPLQLGLIWTFAAGGKLFAYQSGVLVVGYSYGYFDARDLMKMGAWLTLLEFIVLMLLVPFYWPLLGIR